MSGVHKKLREAQFFLMKMSERAQMAFGDRQEFDFYLSAFLSAARTVDYRLRHEQGAAYRTFRVGWNQNLSAADQQLIKFMVDDRNLEIHESGSARGEQESRISVSRVYEDKSGKVTVFSPPDTPPAYIVKPTYFFVVDGQSRSVLECCEMYSQLLKRLVADYCRTAGIK